MNITDTFAVQTIKGGTTFADLIFGAFTEPYALVGLGVASALVGMVTHWIKVYTQEPNAIGFVDWFFVLNKKRTLLAVLSMLGALIAAFAPLDYTTLTAYQTIAQAWTIGYAADSAFSSKSVPRARGTRTRSTDVETQSPQDGTNT